MLIFKTLGSIEGDPDEEGYAIGFDTIEYRGRWWIVAAWLESEDGKHRMPERLIALDSLGYREPEGRRPDDPERFVLLRPMPKAVLDGSATGGVEVLRRPADIRVPVDSPPRAGKLH